MSFSQANYGGRQPNNTAYIKTFNEGNSPSLWNASNYFNSNVLEPSSSTYQNVYIPGNLYVDGIIVNPSDKLMKQNINPIPDIVCESLLQIKCNQYNYSNDNLIHYGFDAIQLNELLPNLLHSTQDNRNYKSINYLEIIPLLLNKIQKMQTELDKLSNDLSNTNKELDKQKMKFKKFKKNYKNDNNN
jgi:hypothetical protein